MKNTIRTATRGISLALALLTAPSLAHAAGFAIYENDARGFAMANANVGRNDDASAIFSNPAAITQLPGVQIKVGVTLIQPTISVTTGNQYTNGSFAMNSYTQVVPNLYATYRLNDNMTVGLGVYTPFGLKSDFQSDPHSWGGAFNSYYTKIETSQVTPTFAYRLVHDQPWAKQISIGAGIGVLYSHIDMRRQLDFASMVAQQIAAAMGLSPNDPQVQAQVPGQLAAKHLPNYTPMIMKGGGWDANYNLSAQWEINDQISLGLVYRSVTRNAYHAASANAVGIESGLAKAGITLPSSWNFGLNYSPVPPLNLGVNLTYTQWSSWQAINVTTYGMGGANGDPLSLNNHTTSQTKDWGNVWRYSFGGEYQINNQVAARAGFTIDKDPVNQAYADFMVPSNDRQIYSLGLGWSINKYVTLDFAYGYLKIKSRNIAARPAEGIYTASFVNTGHANIFTVSGNFRF